MAILARRPGVRGDGASTSRRSAPGTTPTRRAGRDAETIGGALAVGLPLVAYVATASAHGYWLDGSEFVAAGCTLGVSHPPGQPLAVLMAHLCTLFPVGPLAFRIAIASAIAGACATGFLYGALLHTLAAVGLSQPQAQAPLALAGTLLVAGATGFWFQAVRPEVYALQAAIVFFAIERVIAFEVAAPSGQATALWGAAFAVGLALANHHFLGFLILPALAPSFARAYRTSGIRVLLVGCALLLTGLAGYLYLPARAAANPALNLGDPDSVSRFFWVVSAKVFQKNQGSGVPEPWGTRFSDVLVQLDTELHFATLLAAILGAYVLLRTRRARPVAMLWVLVVGSFSIARGWLGFVRGNPDAAGYLAPALAALVALATAFVGALLIVTLRLHQRVMPRAASTLLWIVPLLAAAAVVPSGTEATVATFADTDAISEIEGRTLPPRAVLLVHDPQMAFRWADAQASRGLRPDVTVVPLSFVAYPGVADQLAQRDPLLVPVLRVLLLTGTLSVSSMQDLSKSVPLFLQLDPSVGPEAYGTLVPSYTLHQVLESETYEEDRRPGRLLQDKGWQLLDRLLPQNPDIETKRQLLWKSYHEALYFAAAGDVEAAQICAERGLRWFPLTRELAALRQALALQPEGQPLDIRPFSLDAATPSAP